MDREKSKDLALFTPGPVNLSRSAASALTSGTMHHRTEDFEKIMAQLITYLRSAFFTQGDVAVIASSGTGAMEAVVANFIPPKGSVLVPVLGKFSGRWVDICKVYGVRTHALEFSPGESADADRVYQAILKLESIDALLVTHCETSTGALTDVRLLAEVVSDLSKKIGKKILVGVDCISTLCADEFRLDEWGIDFAVAVSQKGMLAPAGLAMVAIAKPALQILSRSSPQTYYFDLRKYVTGGPRHPFTPPVDLVQAARASIEEILSYGLERVWLWYSRASTALIDLIESAGLKRVAKQTANACIAFWAEDSDRLLRLLIERHRILIAGGQQNLRGKIFRISPLGKSPSDLIRLALGLKDALGEMGFEINKASIEQFMTKVEQGALWA